MTRTVLHRILATSLLTLTLTSCAWQEDYGSYWYDFCYTAKWGKPDHGNDVFVVSRVYYTNVVVCLNKFESFVYERGYHGDLDAITSATEMNVPSFLVEAEAWEHRNKLIREHQERGFRVVYYAGNPFVGD